LSKFLIIDDDKYKYEQIKKELVDNGIREVSIDWAKSKKSALNSMRTERYLVTFLDLNLPEFDDKTPIEKGGFEILEKINLIKNRKKYKKPHYVICLSAHNDIRRAQVDKFLNLDLSIHNFENDSWKTALKTKLDWGLDAVNSRDEDRTLTKMLSITIHGIRTQGKWQEDIDNNLKSKFNGIVCKNYKYNYFSAIKLLLPNFRNKVIADFKEKLIELLDETPNAKVIFFAHSFGTYILLKALEQLPKDVDIRIEKIILAGCVLKEDYDFKTLNSVVDKSRIINDCGFNDGILLLSKYFCVDMGMAGRSGFVGIGFNNRYFKGRHDFFYKIDNFIENYWIPVIDNQVEMIDERKFSSLRENWEIVVSSKLNLSVSLFIIGSIVAISIRILSA
jgi:hypothetical protein